MGSYEGRWWVYVIECRGDRLYTGITTDVNARYRAHCSGRGARFTRAFPPVQLVASAPFAGRSEAASAEFAVKRVPAREKVKVLARLSAQATMDQRMH